jgi:hypothetical protein
MAVGGVLGVVGEEARGLGQGVQRGLTEAAGLKVRFQGGLLGRGQGIVEEAQELFAGGAAGHAVGASSIFWISA